MMMQVVSNGSLGIFQKKRADEMCEEAKRKLDSLNSSFDVTLPDRMLVQENSDWLIAPVYTAVRPDRTVFQHRKGSAHHMDYQDLFIRTVPLSEKTPPNVVAGKVSVKGNIAKLEEVRTLPKEGQNYANASVEINILRALVGEFVRIANAMGVTRFATAYSNEFRHPDVVRKMLDEEIETAHGMKDAEASRAIAS